MFWLKEKRKRLLGASTLSFLLVFSVLTVTYAYVEPDSWNSPSIWLQDSSSDASAIPVNQKVIAVAGTGRGADTAIVVKPVNTTNFTQMELYEIIAKPYTKVRE